MERVQEEVVGSGYVTAVTLQQKLKYSGKAYVLGSSSLAAELSQVGITATGIGVRCLDIKAFVRLSFHAEKRMFLVCMLCVSLHRTV